MIPNSLSQLLRRYNVQGFLYTRDTQTRNTLTGETDTTYFSHRLNVVQLPKTLEADFTYALRTPQGQKQGMELESSDLMFLTLNRIATSADTNSLLRVGGVLYRIKKTVRVDAYNAYMIVCSETPLDGVRVLLSENVSQGLSLTQEVDDD